jgi:hypothetical protein
VKPIQNAPGSPIGPRKSVSISAHRLSSNVFSLTNFRGATRGYGMAKRPPGQRSQCVLWRS